jgi:methylmalonyl-CoA/ethylmalonyl-CoA epimerase
MENNKNLDFANLKVGQLGYVYKDVEKHAKILESVYNTPKFTFFEYYDQPITYRGRETTCSMKMGTLNYFNLNIELIQPLGGESIYQEFLDGGKEGLHHIATYVDDIPAYIASLKKKGIGVLQTGQIVKMHYAYMDTEETFGIIIELWKIITKIRKKKS